MNEDIILGMVKPYLKNGNITYKDFDNIFSMLSLKEQYDAIEVLYKNQIELFEPEDEVSYDKTQNFDTDVEEDLFEILYDNSVFSGVDEENKESVSEKKQEFLIQRKNISLSNTALIQLIQEGDKQAKQDLCVKNERLVMKWVSKCQKQFGNKLDFEDLVQAGMIGMIKAAEKFDLNMGTEFSTYAVWWIKQSVLREIMDNGFTVRIPVHKMEQISRVMRWDSFYSEVLDINERMRKISQKTGMPIENVEDCIILFHQFIKCTSLDSPVGEEEDSMLGDFIPNEEMSVEEIAENDFLKEQFDKILNDLKPREEEIIRLRFGLDDGQPKTLEQIGAMYGVTRERIRQIEAKALRKLRRKRYLDQLMGYNEQ